MNFYEATFAYYSDQQPVQIIFPVEKIKAVDLGSKSLTITALNFFGLY